MNLTFTEIIEKISNELDLEIPLNPVKNFTPIHPKIDPIYKVTNGIDLPFINISPISKIDKTNFPNWFQIGHDYYFSYLLISKNDIDQPVELWDHEIGEEPEGCYDSVEELLTDMYEEFLEKEIKHNLKITYIPEEIKKLKVVILLKKICNLSNQDLLSKLDEIPFFIESFNLGKSVEIKEKLKELNIKTEIETQLTIRST